MRCPTLEQLPAPSPGRTGWPWTEDSPECPGARTAGQPWPRVSVVTPSYNQGRFIEETIRSVLLQGYPDLEYIVMDGGSTDGSVDIIRRYEPWLTYWVSEQDGGQTNAINRGWARATGEILSYINTDDCYLPGALARAAEEFCLHRGLGMVYGAATIVDEDGGELGRWEARPFDLEAMLMSGSIVPQPATFFSRRALDTLGHLNESRQMIMDYELCTRLGVDFPTVCLPLTLARFRAHPHSKTWLHFETTARELVDFVTNFRPKNVSVAEWKRIRRGTLGRVHYEWAKEYVVHGQKGSRPLKQLARSLWLRPGFALRRPMVTAHIVKEALDGAWRTGR